MDALIRCCY